MEANSIRGHLVLFIYSPPISGPEHYRTWHEKITPNDEARVKRGILGFLYYPEPGGSSLAIHIPFSFLSLAIVAAAVAPWIRWSKRFTLRTLLIATTLVAVGLGLIFAAGR
jgi:hypothetical protein